MIFKAFNPCAKLSSYIESIWVQEDLNPVNFGTINPIKVLPSATIVMGFQYGDKQEVTRNGRTEMLSRHGFSGLQTDFALYKNRGSVGSVIVRFKPWAASHFIKIPLIEFQNQNVDSHHVFNRQVVDDVVEKLCICHTIESRVIVVEQYLISLLRDNKTDLLVKNITLEIQKTQGLLRIEDLARHANISKRQLERRFNTIVGIGPKKFSSIIRFQQAINLFEQSDTLTALAYDSGYFDQAHLIKEFNAFTGVTPDQFFARRLQPELSEVFNAKHKLAQFNSALYQ